MGLTSLFKKKADEPRNKTLHTFPVPADYLSRVFRLESSAYRDDERAMALLPAIWDDAPKFYKKERKGFIFQPELDRFIPPDEKPPADDPTYIKETGAVICETYKDFWGREGMTIALLVPNYFNQGALSRNAVTVINGFVDREQGTFHIHDLKHPFFRYPENRLERLHTELLMRDFSVDQCCRFAEKVADALFEGREGTLYNDIYKMWESTAYQYRTKHQFPWQSGRFNAG